MSRTLYQISCKETGEVKDEPGGMVVHVCNPSTCGGRLWQEDWYEVEASLGYNEGKTGDLKDLRECEHLILVRDRSAGPRPPKPHSRIIISVSIDNECSSTKGSVI